MLTWTNAATNIVMDGHSMMAGAATTVPDRIGEQLMLMSPINGGMTYKNVAVSGVDFEQRTAGIASVRNAYESGKQNLLFYMGASNGIQAKTTQQIIDDARAYFAAARATGQVWRAFIIICPAVQEGGNGYEPPVGTNAKLNQFHDYVRSPAGRADLGIEGYVETRPPGGPFDVSVYTYEYNRFVGATPRLYQDGTHLNAAGNTIIAQYLASYIVTIPDVAPDAGPVVQPAVKKLRLVNGKIRLAGGVSMTFTTGG